MCVCCRLVSDKCCFVTGRGEYYGSLTLSRGLSLFVGLCDGIQVVGVLASCQHTSGLFGDRCGLKRGNEHDGRRFIVLIHVFVSR